MSQVKITMPSQPRGAVSAHGLRLEMDGAEIKDITDLTLTFPLDGIAQVHVSCFLEHPIAFDGEATIHLHTHLEEGDQLIETTDHTTNGKSWRVVRKGQQFSRGDQEINSLRRPDHSYHSVGAGACGTCGLSRKEHL